MCSLYENASSWIGICTDHVRIGSQVDACGTAFLSDLWVARMVRLEIEPSGPFGGGLHDDLGMARLWWILMLISAPAWSGKILHRHATYRLAP